MSRSHRLDSCHGANVVLLFVSERCAHQLKLFKLHDVFKLYSYVVNLLERAVIDVVIVTPLLRVYLCIILLKGMVDVEQRYMISSKKFLTSRNRNRP